MLDEVAVRAKSQGIELTFDKSVSKRLCESVSEEDMGARPLRRRITTDIEDMLSARIIQGVLRSGCRAEIVYENESFEVLTLQSAKSG